MNPALATKAETLQRLREAGYRVPKPLFFDLSRWRSDPSGAIDRILTEFVDASALAVRSSCRREDGEAASMAGAFLTVLDVPLDREAIRSAVERVAASYGDRPDPGDQILVQPMVRGIVMSGVIMTRALEDGSPYYVVNYDDESGKTDTVTGGGTISKTVFVFRNFRNSDFDSPRLRNLLRLVRQIEGFFESRSLDIEFAMTSDLEYHVFQVRPIAATAGWVDRIEDEVTDKISFVEDFLRSCSVPRPGLHGSRTILGVMPDWNPAEILGLTPRPLAVSLYRYVITRRIWSRAREEMGYRSMPEEELMLLIAGRPYIDVRASFNSFLPAGLDPAIAEKLVDAWLDRLDRNPNLHDKVEFEIVPTVLDFGFDETFSARYPDLLAPQELDAYREALRRLTLANLDLSPTGSLPRALALVAELESRQEARKPAPSGPPNTTLAAIRQLLEECKQLGTLPFATVARHAFIAEALLRSAAARGALTTQRLLEFKSSIHTISGEFSEDHARLLRGQSNEKQFLSRYGHLRPGTYDILTPTYRDNRERILQGTAPAERTDRREPFRPTAEERRGLDALLTELGTGAFRTDEFLEYAKLAIAGREGAKFTFTRNLSEAIEAIASWGEHHSFGREELSWLSVFDILQTLVAPLLGDPREHFQPLVEQGKRLCGAGKNFKLGFLIRSGRDVYVVPQHRSTPNFVTSRKVTAPVAYLGAREAGSVDVGGRVVCIENADPGYDWLFSRGIAGLVTKFGGTNSHMTIRCSEYGIPAAIGCGEALFATVSKASRCELDAEAKILRAVAL